MWAGVDGLWPAVMLPGRAKFTLFCPDKLRQTLSSHQLIDSYRLQSLELDCDLSETAILASSW